MDITVQELHNRLEAGDKFLFVDVREPWEYEEFNLGAQLVPLGTISLWMEGFGDHKGEEIVVHCRSGARSGQAQALLLAQGFGNVRNLIGGVMAWKNSFD